jgi:hypothetical protein
MPLHVYFALAFIHRPLRWLQLISELRATISGGPNFAYDECVRRIPPDIRRLWISAPGMAQEPNRFMRKR